MTNDLSFAETFWQLLERTGYRSVLPEDADVAAGLKQLDIAANRVALDVLQAETQGVPLHVAAADEVNFPHLFRLHSGIRDILTLELPKELVTWARGLFALKDLGGAEELNLALGQVSADASRAPPARALAKLLLFEGIRLHLLIQEYFTDGGLAGVGVERQDLDKIAEEQLNWWMNESTDRKDVRPLHLLAAAASVDLERHAAALQKLIGPFGRELVDALDRRRQLEGALQKMNTPDALLIRNACADQFDEQYVTLETLQEQHELAFEGRSRAALDKQAQRLREQLAAGRVPERKRPALIDLLEESLERKP